jgi:hypothetical protein
MLTKTKDSSLLLHAIHSPFNWRIKKTILISGFKNPYKTIRETRKENQPENRVYAQKPRLKIASKEFHLWNKRA